MLPVSLCIDFGNSKLKAAIFQGDRMAYKFEFTEDEAIHSLQKIITIHAPKKAILSSVINHSKSIDNFLNQNTKLTLLNSDTPLPFLNAYGTPSTLGNDRLALVAGLSKFYPEQSSLIISIGTCITYSFLAKNNAFRGGAISPGVELRLRSLNEYTDHLPLVQREGHLSILGYDTETCIRSGVINGMLSEISGMIELYESQYGNINAVLTGGDAPFFESRMKKKIFADVNFLFKGLYAILEYQK
ncbi:MAG TPA: type III pantothenate kinase [Chitinophagaceae bacterium]|nr:MAG: putative Baf family transcriptional acitvator [Bacteroidetes bacterium OLB11]HMN32093.1 type III pantothenate kinase [Chitinophagaceae bacterium]